MNYPITELVDARKMAGLGRREVAERIDVSYVTYCRYESGYSKPENKTRETICDFYRNLGVFVLEDDLFPRDQLPDVEFVSLSEIEPDSDELPKVADPEHVVGYGEMLSVIDKALSRLTKRQGSVIKMRFGLDYDEHTLKEVGKVIVASSQAVKELEERALRNLRNYLSFSKLDLFLKDCQTFSGTQYNILNYQSITN